MKTHITISALLVILTAAFVFNTGTKPVNTISTPPIPQSSEFLIGAMDCGTPLDNTHFGELNFNVWHEYSQYGYMNNYVRGWTNWAIHDSLEADVSRYEGDIKHNVLDFNESHGLRTLMHRVKLDFLCYGQRSDYQCETEDYLSERYQDYKFYTYSIVPEEVSRNYTDNSTYGNGVRVRYCRTENSTNEEEWINTPGYVVSGLKANREQINYSGFSSPYMMDHYSKWHIKPRIRIDSNFAHNYQTTPVCRIEIVKWNGDTLKAIILKGGNFLDLSFNYDGRYLETYYFLADTALQILPILSPAYNPLNPDKKSVLNEDCKVDFRVWWYGNCDMWIDYVRVDNDIADRLLKGYYNDPNHPEREWLKWEADLAKYGTSPYRFYIEEFEFNNLPCMKYVRDKLVSYGAPIDLMCCLNISEFNLHKPGWGDNLFTPQQMKRFFVDSLQLKQIFMGGYPFDNATDHIYNPSTLPVSDYNVEQGRIAQPVPPDEYDIYLQEVFDNPVDFNGDPHYLFTGMRLGMQTANAIMKECDIPFINIEEVNLSYNSDPNKWRSKEPTNEELNVMANIAVSYGAKGNLMFLYTSGGEMTSGDYGRGLTNPTQEAWGFEPRDINAYHQQKWEAVKDINNRLKTWGPTLMSFDNTQIHSYIYRIESERDQMYRDNSYIHALRTYKPGDEQLDCSQDNLGFQNPEGLVFDCPDSTYLQVATFKAGLSQAYTQYFMVVNRRCSPIKEDYPDGKRDVRILFYQDHSAFDNYQVWEIVNLFDNSTVATFDKSVYALQDLGWFNPGEGRLYKIVPVP